VYSTVTFKGSESIVGIISVSELAVNNFESRFVQQLAEFFNRIWWV